MSNFHDNGAFPPFVPLKQYSQGLEGIRKQCEALLADPDKAKQDGGSRMLCRYDLRYLCSQILGNQYWDDCHDKLQEFLIENEDEKRKLILFPRGHMKSSIVTVGGSIQRILRDPNIRILITSDTWEIARGFVSQIQSFLNENGELARLFGRFKPYGRGGFGWNKDELTILQRTKPMASATVSSSGTEKAQTGKHYDLIILDDVVSEKNVGTKDQREKVRRFYMNCLSLLDPGGEVWVIGTTWHEADLYNTLRKSDFFKQYVRPALEPPNLLEGKPIHPKRFSLDILRQIRLEDEHGGSHFSAQYLLNPYPEESVEFRKEWLKFYSDLPVDDDGLRQPMYVSVCLDPSLGKDSSDFSGITATGVTPTGNIYVLECRRFKCEIQRIGQEVANTLMSLEARGIRADVVAVEGFGFQQILEVPIRTALQNAGFQNVLVEVLPRSTTETKDARIRAMIPYLADGKIYIQHSMEELQDEMSKYRPDKRNQVDDLLDSMAWNRRYWSMRPSKRVTEITDGTYGQLLKEIRDKRKGNDLLSEFR